MMAILPNIVSAKNNESCKTVSEIAASVMKGRQVGMSINEQFELVDKVFGDSLSEKGMQELKDMVVMAYKRPRMSTAKMQTEMVTDFSNDIFVACYK